MASAEPASPRRIPAWAAIVFLAVVALLSWRSVRPPAAAGIEAPELEFSSARAFRHLETIASVPRPMGSDRHAEVRRYLVEQLEDLGLETEIQAETVVTVFGGRNRVARVQNLLARLPGTSSTGTVLAMSHYDSAPHSPGASDAGSGVVALLEALRALKAGEPLANDVLFLFTDGEERGLLGAQAFQRYHPLAEEVELVLNFEARGASGPSIMFETGPGSGPLVPEFARLVDRPVATSSSYEIYRRLPNDTDFTVFKRAGKRGFNFAYIEDLPAYHTALDRLDRIDRRSLQHHGEQALAMLRGFGNFDFGKVSGQAPSTYFNVLFLGLVVYPATWSQVFGALAVLLAVVALVLAWRSGRAPFGRLLAGAAAPVVALVLAGGAVFLLHRGALALLASRGYVVSPEAYRLGLVLVALAIAAGVLQWTAKKIGLLPASAGALLPGIALVIAALLVALAASYLVVWPLVFGALTVLVLSRAGASLRTELAVLALGLPAILVWIPMIWFLAEAAGPRAHLVLGATAGLLLLALVPQLAACSPGKRQSWLLAGVFLVGLGLVGGQVASAGFAADRPRPVSLFYTLDSDEGSAQWVSWQPLDLPWLRQYLGDQPRQHTMEKFFSQAYDAWVAPAPALDLEPPRVVDLAADGGVEGEGGELAEDTDQAAASTGRTLRLRLTSPRRAATVFLDVRSQSSITSLLLDGRAYPLNSIEPPEGAPAGFWQSAVFGLGDHELVMEISLSGSEPVHVVAVDWVYELPEVPGAGYQPPPDDLRPQPQGTTHASLVRRAFVF